MTTSRKGLATAILLGAAAVVLVLGARVALLLRELSAHGAALHAMTRPAVVLAALLAVALLSAWAARLRPAARANAALAVAAMLAATYAAEAALALGSRDSARLRDKLALLRSLRAGGIAVSPGVEPVRFVWLRAPGAPAALDVGGRPLLPLASIARRRTVDCREGGEWLVYDTDERGFHNPPGLWDSAPLDVAFLGDSFVHGSCVPSDANMVSRVRAVHPSTLNLGTAGAGPLIMLAQLREYLPALRPRTVVWVHFSGNDLLDLRRERGHALLERYLDEGHRQGLDAPLQPVVDAALDAYVDSTLLPALARRAARRVDPVAWLALRDLRQAAGLTVAEPYAGAPTEEEYALFARVLDGARRAAASWSGRLLFVYLPAWEAPPRQLGEDEYVRVKQAAARRTLSIARGLGLEVVDVDERFAAQRDVRSLYACPGCHYGPAGYAVAAEAVLAALP